MLRHCVISESRLVLSLRVSSILVPFSKVLQFEGELLEVFEIVASELRICFVVL